jgi:hypothetical protein
VLLLGLVYGFTKLISKQYGKRLNNWLMSKRLS